MYYGTWLGEEMSWIVARQRIGKTVGLSFNVFSLELEITKGAAKNATMYIVCMKLTTVMLTGLIGLSLMTKDGCSNDDRNKLLDCNGE